MKLTFLGAARTVTGSRFLLETENHRLLIDCGLFQEREYLARNWEPFPVDPASIDTVLLTHAHIDHCGYLPKLGQAGFRGRVLCTRPTVDITGISLLDTAKLQMSDAEHKRKRHRREGRTGPHPVEPLYTVEDVEKIFTQLKPVEYDKAVEVAPGIIATFFDAGHILGSAMIELRVAEADKETVIVFSGDIGRSNKPILQDPHRFSGADVVVMEATYGNRQHKEAKDARSKLADIIHETAAAGGNIVIPTFAIERAQELLYELNHLLHEKRIPELKTFVDSPMATKVTEVFRKYGNVFDKEAQETMARDPDLFRFPLLKFTSSVEESKAINEVKGSAIIMAGSGMCTGGRIKHHLVNNIGRKESTILFVGYQSHGTLGRVVLEQPKKVRIFGEQWTVRARIEKINGFSGHADRDELLTWARAFKNPPRQFFIVHSEEDAAASLAGELRKHPGTAVTIPNYLETVSL